jgi:hypothetical protein
MIVHYKYVQGDSEIKFIVNLIIILDGDRV